MSTSTFSVSYAHTVNYVTTKMMLILMEIIREIGLDPSNFVNSWESHDEALRTWLASRHLRGVKLEIYDPRTNALVTRWDIDVLYDTIGDGELWVDTAAVRYAIKKAGLVPSSCRYKIVLSHAPNPVPVRGWEPCQLRSTVGFRRYAVGATIGGQGLAAQTAYWSR